MRKFLVLTMLIAIMIAHFSISSAEPCPQQANDHHINANEVPDHVPSAVSDETASLGGPSSRLLAQKYRSRMTCNMNRRVCRLAWSPGPDCCKKQCVDTKKDKWNCGKCGIRCKYTEICCKGKCINPMFNRKNCGGCFNKCKKGSSCVYGEYFNTYF